MWEIIKDGVFAIIQFFYNLCFDWGMAIIIVTVIFRLLITPLMYTQSRSSYRMQKLQPALSAIKEKFADDPVRQNEETQKVYAEAKFNPLSGCIPMLIQMPIFIALFQVLREMGTRVAGTGTYSFYNIVPDLVMTPADAWNMIADSGVGIFIPYIILLLIFALATFVPSLLMTRNNGNPDQRKQTLIMSLVMSVMMIWIGWSSPAGVLLFWGASSLLAIAQQQGSLAYLRAQDKKSGNDVIVVDETPKKIEVTRKTKKKRQSKKR